MGQLIPTRLRVGTLLMPSQLVGPVHLEFVLLRSLERDLYWAGSPSDD